MLIGFKVSNFRSFAQEQELRCPSPAQTPEGRMQLAVIFGPNGAGKTNLLLALAGLRDLVLNSATCSDEQYAAHYTPFQFGDTEDRPTDFDVEVVIQGTRYHYTLSYDGQRVRHERLLVCVTGKSQRWFERRWDDGARDYAWPPFSHHFNGSRELWRRVTRPRSLFLSTAAQLGCEQLKPLVGWFEHGLGIRLAHSGADLRPVVTAVADPERKKRLLDVLHAVDVPVGDLRIKEDGPSGAPGLELLHVRPGRPSRWLDSADEARGTLRLLGALGPLLQAAALGGTLAIDEFNAGLHPLVARFLVGLARGPGPAGGGSQLLLISHDAALMDPQVLERDEIWLMERDPGGASRLVPVAARGARRSEPFGRSYLRGRYGAVPSIRSKEVFENVIPHTPGDVANQVPLAHRSFM